MAAIAERFARFVVDTPKGDPQWQLTRDELKIRFDDLAGRVFDRAHVDRIYDAVYALEDAGDIRAWCACACAKAGAPEGAACRCAGAKEPFHHVIGDTQPRGRTAT
jgi:hypothetical protein